MSRNVRLWTFCSVKGGVGKSTLAVTVAKLIQSTGGSAVVIDCDLTGTSLADGLNLCAPKLPTRTDGSVNLDADWGEDFHDREETNRLRARRRDARSTTLPPPPAFLNDVLAYDGRIRVSSTLWRAVRDDGVRYLPSSSLHRDVRSGLVWLSGEPFDWVHRLAWVMDALIDELAELTDIVLDLPPGVWGFSHEALVLTSMLSRSKPLPEGFPMWLGDGRRIETRTCLLMTQGRGDMLPSLEYVVRAYTEGRLPALMAVINRTTLAPQSVREHTRELLGSTLGVLQIDQRLKFVNELKETLGRLFLDGDFAIDHEVRSVGRTLGLES